MSRFVIGQRWLLGAVALLMCSGAQPAYAFQNGIVANDAVVLAPKASPLDVPVAPIAAISTDQTPQVPNPPAASTDTTLKDANQTASTATTPEKPVVARPVNESMGLGRPTASVENPKSEAVVGETSPNWLSSLDPRKNEITRVLGALAVVIGLLLLGKSFLRRAGGVMAGGERPSGVVEILARYPVARGQQMILMKIARRIVLLHHAGTTMTPISEITDVDEVAGLLGRMEAGSNQRSAAKFRQTLAEFHSEHENATRFTRPRGLPRGETQVIDLTRSQGKGIGRILGKRAAR